MAFTNGRPRTRSQGLQPLHRQALQLPPSPCHLRVQPEASAAAGTGIHRSRFYQVRPCAFGRCVCLLLACQTSCPSLTCGIQVGLARTRRHGRKSRLGVRIQGQRQEPPHGDQGSLHTGGRSLGDKRRRSFAPASTSARRQSTAGFRRCACPEGSRPVE